MEAIKLKQVKKTFDNPDGKKFLVLTNINLEIKRGEFLVCVGPSGCGKSTLLRLISGLDKIYDGKITVEQSIGPNDFGFVFQQFALLPWLNVFENVELGLVARGLPKNQRQELVTAELKQFKLERFANSRIRELSGGMQQRVGLARAFVIQPKVIFMDEPFSELDSFTAEELRQDLLQIWVERKMTVVMVTHLIPEAIKLADRIAVFSALPGRIKEVIDNHLVRPRLERSPEFFALEDLLYSLIRT